MQGRTRHLTTSFTPNAAIKANSIIASVMARQPLLLEWRGEVYVLYGVLYDEHLYDTGAQDNVIRELLLNDPRHSDDRRFLTFEREKDNFAEVSGIAAISVASQ